MLIVASSPLPRPQRADTNTLTSSSPRQRATAPPPPPFDKILSIDKRHQTTGYGRVGPSADAGVGGEAMESILAVGERHVGDADEARSAAAAADADACAIAVLAARLSA